jgi:hypothetical protein
MRFVARTCFLIAALASSLVFACGELIASNNDEPHATFSSCPVTGPVRLYAGLVCASPSSDVAVRLDNLFLREAE